MKEVSIDSKGKKDIKIPHCGPAQATTAGLASIGISKEARALGEELAKGEQVAKMKKKAEC